MVSPSDPRVVPPLAGLWWVQALDLVPPRTIVVVLGALKRELNKVVWADLPTLLWIDGAIQYFNSTSKPMYWPIFNTRSVDSSPSSTAVLG